MRHPSMTANSGGSASRLSSARSTSRARSSTAASETRGQLSGKVDGHRLTSRPWLLVKVPSRGSPKGPLTLVGTKPIYLAGYCPKRGRRQMSGTAAQAINLSTVRIWRRSDRGLWGQPGQGVTSELRQRRLPFRPGGAPGRSPDGKGPRDLPSFSINYHRRPRSGWGLTCSSRPPAGGGGQSSGSRGAVGPTTVRAGRQSPAPARRQRPRS